MVSSTFIASDSPLLELRDIACERDERILFEGLNLSVESGDLVQLEGPNGSGKTTLLRVLTTISSDYSGEIFWCGKPLSKVKHDYLSHLLYVGHLTGIKKVLSPRENLTWYAGLNEGRQRISVEQALEEVGLFGYEDMPCYQLSAGQNRRVALARLFFTPACLWILDEPFTAIDVAGVESLQNLMLEHVAGGGAVILTTHQSLTTDRVKRVNLTHFLPRAMEEGQ